MFSEAFAYPRKGGPRDLLVGGLLVLASPLVVPLVLLAGYQLRVMDAAARGRESPPVLGDWERLLGDGLKAAVVWVVYGLLPLGLVAAVPAGAWAVLGVGGLRRLPRVQLLVGVGVLAAVLVLAVVLWLHLPAALVAVGTQGRLGAAFQTDALWAVVSTKAYVVGVALAAFVAVGGGLLALVLTPLLVGLVVQFYVQVAVAYLFGRAVGGGAVRAIQVAE